MVPIISEQVELVQVLLFLSDRQERVMQYIDNKLYSEAIKTYFLPYINHKAVILTKKLIDNHNFIHIKPLRAILSLEQISTDKENDLYEWASSVKEFITDTDFKTFYLNQSDYYDWILNNLKQCDVDIYIDYIEQYFRQKPVKFQLIICPIAGNYGFNLLNTSYIVRCMPYYDQNQNPDWKFEFFAKGIAHEYAHCFVNPTVEAYKSILKEYDTFFKSHTNMSNAYNVDYAVMNEYWVRAFTIRFMEQNQRLFPDFDIAEEYRFQKESFIYIEKFIELLKKFEKTELSFEDFYLDTMKKFIFNENCKSI